MNVTMIFYWIGLVGAIIIGISLLAVVGSYVAGFCSDAFKHGRIRYRYTKMYKKTTASIGHTCALWLSNYNSTHRFVGNGFTSGDWERYFGKQLRNEK